jgi:DNA-binding beta-propeller fold protein YncE
MPWLTVHITLPMILLSGWALGVIIDRVDWSRFKNSRAWLTILFLAVFIVTFLISIGSLLGSTPPFQGKELTQLRATSTFIFSLLMFFISGVGLYTLLKTWPWGQLVKVILLSLFTLMGILTFRTSISANFQNYDNANELLVYAHSARGVKDALDQIEEISRRTTDGMAIQVAYDNETSYPYYWYFRNYPNARFYGKDPSRSLRDSAAILVGEPNYAKIEPVVGEAYYKQDYIRLWWPNQDYYGLTLKRIWEAVKNPEMREALFRIWLDRDYSRYGEVLGRDMSLPNWSPAVKMRLYIRKDIASSLWNYGIAPTEEQVIADPYEGKGENLSADRVIGSFGSEPGQLNRPRDLALAEDGSIFVADTENHRIQHFNQDGTLIHQWGSFGDITAGEAPGGTFNQPWGLALGQDGSVYVADLWNHRIQKFTPEGEFIKMWGYFGQAESPEAFWGPRDVAVDSKDRVFVVDTGNKRVVIFDEDGNFVSQFGSVGMAMGQFDEPVGITIDEEDRVYIADTWNQRIQKFDIDAGGEYQPVQEWEVYAWFGESLDNKPYLDIDPQGFLYVTDPEGLRVLEFKDDGTFIRFWGDLGAGLNQFALVGSVAVDPSGGVWVTDTGNNRIMHFPVTNP